MSCSDVQTIKAGDGSKLTFSFDFPYIFKSEIHVYFWNVTTKEWDEKLTTDSTYPWQITDANPTIVEFTGDAPPAPTTPTVPNEETQDNVRIRRITKVDDIRALFNPGSAIRSNDLNKNFEQLRYAIQESGCQDVPEDLKEYLEEYYWDRYNNTLYDGDTWVSDDTNIASTEAIDDRIDFKVDTALENDVLVDSSGLTKSASGGQVTIGIAADSVDLDRIKSEDIIISGETNPNNDTTIATTAAIDDMIDAAITGDIATDDTGITITDDGDGTITLGLADIDLDRIKDDDIITLAEQDAGPTTDDDSIFTSSAAAKRFDTLVQVDTPSGSDYETGKTWLQNDDDQALKIWNGETWLEVVSGGTFRTQDKVIYVDKSGGDDDKTGHRISGPKLTIKAAIEDINADISISTNSSDGFDGGSGYTNGTYTNVPLTGGTTGSGLTADITVSGGAVTEVSDINASTLEEYQIGDILSASDSDLGGGGGSGLEIPIIGGGDGMTVIVAAGVYQETAPIQIKRRNVSIIGMALRSCIVHPTVATEKPSDAGNSALFELNSGSFVQNLTLTGMQASDSGTNTIDSDLPDKQGWNFAFYNDAYITKSPYVQNCTNFSDSQIDNDGPLLPHRPRGGQAGDLTNSPTGGGMLIDGSVPKTTSPLRSMVADSYTHVGLNGPGILVTNNGYAQCTSSYAFFNKYHIKALNGGQANLAASTTDFGEKALVADGRSTTNIFTADCVTAVDTSGDVVTTIRVSNGTADASWHGDQTRPATNMLLSVNSDAQTYPILSAVPQDESTYDEDPAGYTGDWIVTISRPDPDDRSTNLGFSADVATGTDNVQFFLRSQIASSGHTMEYVGSGMDYDALPENGGVPDESAQITELNNGKIWTAITDHNGKFKIGGNQTDDPIFEVDQQLGFVTIPEGSIAFNLLSDETPQLGGNLDVNGNEIVTDSDNENIVLNPHGTGAVNVSSSKIINLTDPTDDQDAATKSYVDDQIGGIDEVVEDLTPQLGGDLDINGKAIVSDSNENIVLNPGTGGNVNFSNSLLIGVQDPVSAQDAATKSYVDNEVAGLLDDVVDDTTPQLGGDLDVNGNDIVSVSNGDINIVPDGSGTLTLDGITVADFTVGTSGQTDLTLNPNQNIRVQSTIVSDTNSDITLNAQGTGNINVSSNRITSVTDPTDAQDAATKNYVDTNTISDVVEDTTPQLGGDLDSNGNNINFGDDDRAQFGAGNDLQIYHDGSNSFIEDSGAGSLFIRGSDLVLEDAGGNDYITCSDSGTGGTVTIKHLGTAKLTTTADGVDFDGTGSITVPQGTTAQRPTGVNGMFRYNSDDDRFEGYINDAWGAIGNGPRGENTITASTFDLKDGPFWTCADITIPVPTNGSAGFSGLIRVTAAPTFATGWDFPGGTYTAPTAFPAIAPFYVVDSSTFLLGNWTEGIA